MKAAAKANKVAPAEAPGMHELLHAADHAISKLQTHHTPLLPEDLRRMSGSIHMSLTSRWQRSCHIILSLKARNLAEHDTFALSG